MEFSDKMKKQLRDIGVDPADLTANNPNVAHLAGAVLDKMPPDVVLLSGLNALTNHVIAMAEIIATVGDRCRVCPSDTEFCAHCEAESMVYQDAMHKFAAVRDTLANWIKRNIKGGWKV